MSGDLKFDKMVVQVENAKKYMELHKNNFNSIGYKTSNKSAKDSCNNNILYADYTRTIQSLGLEEYQNIPAHEYVCSLYEKFTRLVENIKVKQMLFAETEYMLRKTPIEQTLNFDLKLIVQNIIYVLSSPQVKFYKSNVIVMKENSPLATLGLVSQMLCAHKQVIIESTVETAVLCHIFTGACHDAGLNNVNLAFVESSPPGGNDVMEIKELQVGCVAVVTESADVDSAVDAIIGTHDVFPWGVRRVLVQESIGERFRRALSWKSAHPRATELDQDNTKCTARFEANGKVFVYECTSPYERGHVVLEEYRTVKELLSLSNASVPFAVSLWCANVSEANEIAHGVPSTVVWVNAFGRFDGPPPTSQAFYSILDVAFAGIDVLASLVEKLPGRESWLKLSVSRRRELVLEAMKPFKKETVGSDTSLSHREWDASFANVDSDYVCMGLYQPVGLVLYHDEGQSILDSLSALLVGNGVLTFNRNWSEMALYTALKGAGVPLQVVDVSTTEGCVKIPSKYSMYRTKVVWTSFGTVFAN